MTMGAWSSEAKHRNAFWHWWTPWRPKWVYDVPGRYVTVLYRLEDTLQNDILPRWRKAMKEETKCELAFRMAAGICPYSGELTPLEAINWLESRCYLTDPAASPAPAEPAAKPPLGITPRKLHDEKRMADLKAAILRYVEAGAEIPREWTDEFNELLRMGKNL